MSFSAFKTELRDGTPVLVRPIRRDDKHLLAMGLEQLSPRSRYFRFFRPVRRLSDDALEDFTEVDQVSHIASGALDLTHREPYPVGIARCVRLPDDPEEAEVAVTVIDTHQGRGLGTILLAAVAFASLDRGVKSFVGTILRENRSMLELFGELGATQTPDAPGVVRVRIPLHRDADDYPETPAGLAFRRVFALLD